MIVLACCDETKFGPNLISLSPHVSHFIRSINTLSGFNETPAVNYWLDSLRPIRARPSQVGIKLGISVVRGLTGRLGLPPPPPPPCSVSSQHTVVVQRSDRSDVEMVL